MTPREKIREARSRVKTWMKDKLNDGSEIPRQSSAPALLDERTVAPGEQQLSGREPIAHVISHSADTGTSPPIDTVSISLPVLGHASGGLVVQGSRLSPSLRNIDPPGVNPNESVAIEAGDLPETLPSRTNLAALTLPTVGNTLPPSTPSPSSKRMPLGLEIPERVKPDHWTNLAGLLDALSHVATITGLGQVKTIIEGFASCIGIYKEAAQGRKEYEELQQQLEGIFGELKIYISSSVVITTSIESICGSIQKELEYIKRQRDGPRVRRLQEAEIDVDNVLKCYQRINGHMERLSRNANISTWIIVDQIATESRLRDLSTSSWACYNSEKALELKRRSCTEGTRTTVLAQMHQWAAGQDTGNIYWMSGMAGTGKTTIAYSLCQQLDDKANRMLCASFFCSRSLPECRDVGRIIPSIAYQLAQFSRPFRYALSQATEKDPLAHTRLPQMQFESLILEPLSNPAVREALPMSMVAVIDALDECDDVKSTKQILDVLLTKSKNLPIKFVVSSRPEPAIRDQMEKNGTWIDARVVLHELDSGEVKADIKTYLKAELAPARPLESEIEKLAKRAGVLFIYAATVVRYVGYDDFARGRARLKLVLGVSERQSKAQTEEIDQLYGTILEAAVGDTKLEPTERDDIKLILDTVICARAPLTVAALNKLLQFDDLDRVQAAIRPLWSVLHVMGPNMAVTTLHASFPDYLLDSQRSGAWYCNAATHHHLLAQRCFDCIRDTKPQFNVCQLESSYLLDEEVVDLDGRVKKFISSELHYSCQYWSSHLDATEPSTAPGLALMLSQFLSMNLLLWLEVRNLTKSGPTTVGELTAAKQWATRHGVTRNVSELLSDAWRFASTFVSNPVSQSTPHLYVSMLPLLPSSSPIRKHYSSRFVGIIGTEGTALDRRRNALLAQWNFTLHVKCVACSPDAIRVAIGGSSRPYGRGQDRLYILDAFGGTLLLDLSQGNQTEVHSIAFSPDSTRLASGRSDGVISVWDVIEGQSLLGPFSAHRNCVSSIQYSHDGSYIFSASKDKIVRIWDALSGDPALTPLIGHTDNVTCIAIASDDARLVSGSWDGTIRIWDIQSGKLILDPIIARGDVVRAVALSPDNSYVVSGSSSGNIRVWDTQTGQMMLGPLRDQAGWTVSLSISPDGATIASTSHVDGVRVWSAASGRLVSRYGPFSGNDGRDAWATYSPDGTRIIFSRHDGTMRLLDTQTADAASDPLPGHTRGITSIDISPDGQHLVTGSLDLTLYVWNVNQGTLITGPLQGHTSYVNMVRFSPDSSRIVSCDSEYVHQWDVQTGAACGSLIMVPSATLSRTKVVSATYSKNGVYIATLTNKGDVSLWSPHSGQCNWGPTDAPKNSNGLYADFSPNSETVIAGYTDGLICAWKVSSGQMLFSHQGHGQSDISSLVFSPDGLYYAQSFSDGKISLNMIQTGEMSGLLEGHTRDLSSMRFSSDGTQLVSGSGDKTIHIWDVETGQSSLGPLNGHTHGVKSVAFSPDRKFVVSVSDDMAIRAWNIEPKAPSGQNRNAEYDNWVLDGQGWVISGSSQRLLWVPADLRASLLSPRNTALISRDGNWRVIFDDALVGQAWDSCFRGC